MQIDSGTQKGVSETVWTRLLSSIYLVVDHIHRPIVSRGIFPFPSCAQPHVYIHRYGDTERPRGGGQRSRYERARAMTL